MQECRSNMAGYRGLTDAQRAALQAAHGGRIERAGYGRRCQAAGRTIAGPTIRALVDRDLLADDELGGFIVTPAGRRVIEAHAR